MITLNPIDSTHACSPVLSDPSGRGALPSDSRLRSVQGVRAPVEPLARKAPGRKTLGRPVARILPFLVQRIYATGRLFFQGDAIC